MARTDVVKLKDKAGSTLIINRDDYDPDGAHKGFEVAHTRLITDPLTAPAPIVVADEPAGAAPAVPADAPVAEAVTLNPNWRTMSLRDMRDHVAAVTGTRPQSRADAERLILAMLDGGD